jgi:hypothetical protein
MENNMTLAVDYFGHEYEDTLPAFVEVDGKHLLHRMTSRFLDKVDLLAQWQSESYSPGAKEVGPAADWLWEHYSIGAPSGGGPNPAPYAEPTLVVAGLNTPVVTLTITLPPDTVCVQGNIVAYALTIGGYNRGVDERLEPLIDPPYWVGWFGDQQVDPPAPPIVGLTAEQIAALWTINGPSSDGNSIVTSIASGNVVTITETGGKLITRYDVEWTKT